MRNENQTIKIFILKFTADSISPQEWNTYGFFLDQNIEIKKNAF